MNQHQINQIHSALGGIESILNQVKLLSEPEPNLDICQNGIADNVGEITTCLQNILIEEQRINDAKEG